MAQVGGFVKYIIPSFYSSAAWRRLRDLARSRDDNRCTVSRLLGGDCRGVLHGHHIDPDADPLDIDNVGTVCSSHHPRWEALRRSLVDANQGPWRSCPHRHRTAEGRRQCEARLNRVALSA